MEYKREKRKRRACVLFPGSHDVSCLALLYPPHHAEEKDLKLIACVFFLSFSYLYQILYHSNNNKTNLAQGAGVEGRYSYEPVHWRGLEKMEKYTMTRLKCCNRA